MQARIQQKRIVLIPRKREEKHWLADFRRVLFESVYLLEQFSIVMLKHVQYIGVNVDHGKAVTDQIKKGAVARSFTMIAIPAFGFKSQSLPRADKLLRRY